MKVNKDIQILLSSYNGEQYLREQFESYIAQDIFSRVKILVRDDGSTDGTLVILSEYREKLGEDVVEIIEGDNIGVNASINELFRRCDERCSYFAISDQDDVWMPNKLSRAVNALFAQEQKAPLLFASCSYITDSELNIIGKTVNPIKGVSFYNAMIQNVCPGHTQVFNRATLYELRHLLEKYVNGIHVIDHWIYLTASAFGKVIFDQEPTVLHRQHGKNAVGYQLGWLAKTVTRIRRFKFKEPDKMTLQLRCFYSLYYSDNKGFPEFCELDAFLNSKTFFKRLSYAFRTKCIRQDTFDSFLFRFLFIIGKYHE